MKDGICGRAEVQTTLGTLKLAVYLARLAFGFNQIALVMVASYPHGAVMAVTHSSFVGCILSHNLADDRSQRNNKDSSSPNADIVVS